MGANGIALPPIASGQACVGLTSSVGAMKAGPFSGLFCFVLFCFALLRTSYNFILIIYFFVTPVRVKQERQEREERQEEERQGRKEESRAEEGRTKKAKKAKKKKSKTGEHPFFT